MSESELPSPVPAGEPGLPASPPTSEEPALNSTPPPPAETPAPGNPGEPIRFHGDAKEYFRIWIVNTLLTFLTAGVFLAWAKVRKRRYLRGSTELMGHRFDYRADPKRILVGNIIVLAFFLAYGLFGVVYPAIRMGSMVVAVLLLPWVVVRSMTFNAHNTVYRGMCFRFSPSLSASAIVYLLEPLLILVTLGIYYPAWERSKKRYIISHHRLGDAYFDFDGSTGRFFTAYFLGGLMIAGFSLMAGVLFAVVQLIAPGGPPSSPMMLLFFLIYGFGAFLARHFVYARIFNHVWNHTRLDEHRFVASLDTGHWIGLQLANLGAIIGTCGLMYPWALIRSKKYLATCLVFQPAGPIDKIERVGGASGSGVGDSAAEFVGLDFGL